MSFYLLYWDRITFKTKVIMEETSSPYKWLGYMIAWMVACPFIFVMGDASDEIILFLFMATIVINIYCAYKFALEKGILLAILAFVVAIALNILFPMLLYVVLLGFTWRN